MLRSARRANEDAVAAQVGRVVAQGVVDGLPVELGAGSSGGGAGGAGSGGNGAGGETFTTAACGGSQSVGGEGGLVVCPRCAATANCQPTRR